MGVYNGRRIFRTAPWLIGAVAAADMLFVGGAWFSYWSQGLGMMTMLYIGLATFGVLGIVEALTARLLLADDALHVTKFWTRRSYPRETIRQATYAKGCPVTLELSNGQWAKLPDLGHNTQGITNSIRAWLRATV
jgi:hypothetical protein